MKSVVCLSLLCTVAQGCETPMDFYRAGASELCVPGSTIACYAGPEETRGIGICRDGMSTCSADGSGYGDCTGSVTPELEDCTTSVDENCDGSPACTGNLIWSKRFGSDAEEIVTAVALDDAGAIFFTGTFTGSVDFGGGPLVSAGGGDVFLVKLDPNGNHVWSRRFGDANSPQIATSLAVDNVGNVLIAGQFTGGIDFGAGPLPTLGGQSEIFVAKFDNGGDSIWSQAIGNLGENAVTSIATDGSNDVALAITSNALLVIGGDSLMPAGGFDVALAELNSEGTYSWSERFGDASDQYGSGIARTSGGDTVTSATFLGTIDFGGSTLVSQGGADIALARLTPTGAHIWSRRFGDSSDQAVHDIALDGAESTVAVGSFAGTIDFGGGPLPSSGDYDVFVAKLDAGGDTLWGRRFGTSGFQGADRVDIDGGGNVLVAGHFVASVDFGGEVLVSAGGDDIFLVKLAPDGSHIWSKRFGDANDQSFADVAADGGGNVVLVGSFPGSVDFGAGPLVSAGGSDIFVAKFSP